MGQYSMYRLVGVNMRKYLMICLLLICQLTFSGCNNFDIQSNPLDKELSIAISSNCYDKAVEAVSNGANISEFNDRALCERTNHNRLISSPVLLSLWHGAYDIAEYLILCGADVNYTDKSGESILQYCAEFYPRIIQLVIDAGADLNYVDDYGKTALDYSVKYNVNNAPKMAFDVLIENGAVPTEKTVSIILDNIDIDRYGMLKTSLSYEDPSFVDESVKKVFSGECIFSNTPQPEFVLEGIAAFGCWDCLKKNIIYSNCHSIQNLLKSAIKYNNKSVIKQILNNYPKLKLDEKNDFLYYACENNDIETVDLIYTKIGGNVPLAISRAIALHNNNIVDYFISKNVDLSKPVLEGTLLCSCCMYNNFEAAEKILNTGIIPDDRSTILASKYGYFDFLELFFENGANANSQYAGYSALMEAVSSGYYDCVEMLVKEGADIYYEYYGKNAIELAENSSSKRIYEYLTQKDGSVVSDKN